LPILRTTGGNSRQGMLELRPAESRNVGIFVAAAPLRKQPGIFVDSTLGLHRALCGNAVDGSAWNPNERHVDPRTEQPQRCNFRRQRGNTGLWIWTMVDGFKRRLAAWQPAAYRLQPPLGSTARSCRIGIVRRLPHRNHLHHCVHCGIRSQQHRGPGIRRFAPFLPSGCSVNPGRFRFYFRPAGRPGPLWAPRRKQPHRRAGQKLCHCSVFIWIRNAEHRQLRPSRRIFWAATLQPAGSIRCARSAEITLLRPRFVLRSPYSLSPPLSARFCSPDFPGARKKPRIPQVSQIKLFSFPCNPCNPWLFFRCRYPRS